MTRPVPSISQLPIDLQKAFEGMLSEASGPFGATSLSRVITKHVMLFADLRRQGATWEQITRLLATHGVGHGRALTAGVVRATFARAMVSETTKHKVTERSAPKLNETNHSNVALEVTHSNVMERNDVKHDESIELSRRSSLIDKPWHTR